MGDQNQKPVQSLILMEKQIMGVDQNLRHQAQERNCCMVFS